MELCMFAYLRDHFRWCIWSSIRSRSFLINLNYVLQFFFCRKLPYVSWFNSRIVLLQLIIFCCCLCVQVERFACLYTSQVSNLSLYSPDKYYRPSEDFMPHEFDILPVWWPPVWVPTCFQGSLIHFLVVGRIKTLQVLMVFFCLFPFNYAWMFH